MKALRKQAVQECFILGFKSYFYYWLLTEQKSQGDSPKSTNLSLCKEKPPGNIVIWKQVFFFFSSWDLCFSNHSYPHESNDNHCAWPHPWWNGYFCQTWQKVLKGKEKDLSPIVETQEVFTLTEYFTWKVVSLKCVFRPKKKAQKSRNNLNTHQQEGDWLNAMAIHWYTGMLQSHEKGDRFICNHCAGQKCII